MKLEGMIDSSYITMIHLSSFVLFCFSKKFGEKQFNLDELTVFLYMKFSLNYFKFSIFWKSIDLWNTLCFSLTYQKKPSEKSDSVKL